MCAAVFGTFDGRRGGIASCIGKEPDRLAGYRRDSLEIAIVAQHREPFAFRGRGNEQVDRAG